jgi:hypothetical protein
VRALAIIGGALIVLAAVWGYALLLTILSYRGDAHVTLSSGVLDRLWSMLAVGVALMLVHEWRAAHVPTTSDA